MNRRTLFTTLGFILFIGGLLSLTLMIVGVQFTFLKWMDFYGRGLGFLFRVIAVIVGIVLIYTSATSDSED